MSWASWAVCLVVYSTVTRFIFLKHFLYCCSLVPAPVMERGIQYPGIIVCLQGERKRCVTSSMVLCLYKTCQHYFLQLFCMNPTHLVLELRLAWYTLNISYSFLEMWLCLLFTDLHNCPSTSSSWPTPLTLPGPAEIPPTSWSLPRSLMPEQLLAPLNLRELKPILNTWHSVEYLVLLIPLYSWHLV